MSDQSVEVNTNTYSVQWGDLDLTEDIADGDDAVLGPDGVPIANVRRGIRNKALIQGTGLKGGPYTIAIMPGTPSDRALRERAQARRDGEPNKPEKLTIKIGEGDSAQTDSAEEAYMTDYPIGNSFGSGNWMNKTLMLEAIEVRAS